MENKESPLIYELYSMQIMMTAKSFGYNLFLLVTLIFKETDMVETCFLENAWSSQKEEYEI